MSVRQGCPDRVAGRFAAVRAELLTPLLAAPLLAALLVACSGSGSSGLRGNHFANKGQSDAHEQVVATERAFARTMVTRDFQAFTTFISPEAIFFTGAKVEHGPKAIEATWGPYFAGPAAPFTWAPDNVEVLPSGTLALSTGPVYVDGKEVARYNAIWRLEAKNTWHIIFDKGEAVCSVNP
jgi:ketosteroid isomerase-like protein